MPITLPTEPTPPLTQSPKSLVIYGPPKIGKTSIVSKLPFKTLVADCENGSDYITGYKVKVKTYSELRELCLTLATTTQFDCAVFDTIDAIEDWCTVRATQMYKSTPIGSNFAGSSCLTLPMGAGYQWLRNAFHEALDLMLKSAPRVVILGHIKDKMLTQAGKEVSAVDLDLTGKVKNILCSRVDAIANAYRNKEGKLILTFKTSDTVCCGARNEHLKNKDIAFSYPEATPEDWKQIYID